MLVEKATLHAHRPPTCHCLKGPSSSHGSKAWLYTHVVVVPRQLTNGQQGHTDGVLQRDKGESCHAQAMLNNRNMS